MKCNKCGADIPKGEALTVNKKKYCSMECAELYKEIYYPPKKEEEK